MAKKRGRNAANNGRHNEQTFEAKLIDCGYSRAHDHESMGSHMFVSQVPFAHPWKQHGYADFMLVTPSSKRVLVQNKNQNCSGTTDEKIPFQFDLAKWSQVELQFDEFWLVLGGQYWPTNDGMKRVRAYRRKGEETHVMSGHRLICRVFLQNGRHLSRALRVGHEHMMEYGNADPF